MDWIKDNKFLAGFAGFTLVGTIALAYFLITGWLSYSDSYSRYQDLSSRNQSLAAKNVFPSESNLELEEKRVEKYAAMSKDLGAKLLARQSGIEDITVDSFPVLLGEAYDKVVAKAADSSFSLPEGFFFGMQRYKDGLPAEGAVDDLGMQLSALTNLVDVLIDSGAAGIDEFIQREEMPSENPGGAPEERENQRGGPPRNWPEFRDGRIPYAPEEVLDTHRFRIQFTATHDAMVEFLNNMAKDKQHFYWLRALRIENQSKEGKSREDEFVPFPVPQELPEEGDALAGDVELFDDPGATVQFDENGNPIESDFTGPLIDARILFGAEQVKVLAIVDIVRFKESEESSGDASTASAN
ncbi:MAG: Amuc_1100 family pilus-like protein [Verrucomicrobiota bacterium]